MKKRIISMLLIVLMVMSLFSGLSFGAEAATVNGANTITYTMSQGDYVLRICQQLGLNYYTCKDAIMILNGISDGQWSKLSTGMTLTLPASDYDAQLIANGGITTTYSSGTVVTTGVTGTATTTATSSTVNSATNTARTQDQLAYYLVPYTISAGETVSGVCNNLGVNFSIFQSFIKQVNGIDNWTKVRAGQTLIIPTPVCPSVGTSCYGVMQHKITNSDTAYSIVNAAGVNYNANKQLLEALNQTDNLAAIRAGNLFFYPVPMTVSVPGTGNPGSTATTTTTTTVTDGNGTTVTSTTTTAKLYKITSSMSSSDGTMLFYVDNQPVTAAIAGAKVTVVTNTASGKAIQSLTVKQSDGKADFLLTGDTFVMPACDVRVDAAIKSGYDITIEANYSGKASASVGGVSVQSAVKGATVVVKSVDPNYEISSLFVYYQKLVSSSNKTEVKHSTSNAFIMPDMPVTVEVTLRTVSTYAFYVNDPLNGSFYLKVNGSPVTRAAKGAEVTVVTTPETGYTPGVITVTKHDDPTKIVNFFNNGFTMPGYDVDVFVTFVAKGNNILIMPADGGEVVAYAATGWLTPTNVDTTEEIEEAGTGDWVALLDTPDVGFQLDPNDPYDIVRISDGLKVNVRGPIDLTDQDGNTSPYYCFKMPKGGVTVTPRFVGVNSSLIESEIQLDGVPVTAYSDCSFSVIIDGVKSEYQTTGNRTSTGAILTVPYGKYIDLRYDCADGIAFVKYVIYKAETPVTDPPTYPAQPDEELSNQATLHGYITMPDTPIKIVAYFEKGKVPIGPAAVTGIGTVSYRTQKIPDVPADWAGVWTAWIESFGTTVNAAAPGERVFIIAQPGNGYKFDADHYDVKLVVTRKDNGAPIPLDDTIAPVPVRDLRTGNIYAYQYSFVMPAEGVDVTCVFDPKPFRIVMKCVDETGKDLSGLGLWQIAVNGVPGITDMSMLGMAVVEVAYEDYITVAMTEAGWSKYDMVSFRIDGLEYTADVLNYFYNFQMIGDRAKDLEIVAVMRPSTPYTISIHNLMAMYDTTKGGVEFLILSSPTGYSDEFRMNSSGRLNYVKKAIAGDVVAIVANSVDSKYEVKASDISIVPWNSDADRIVPSEAWVNEFGAFVPAGTAGAIKVFYFTMPDSDMTITVNYSGTKQALYVSVFDMDNNPVRGMVRVFANDTYRDVAADASFDDISYKTQVQILRSELALAESKVIKDVDIHTASGNSVPYTDLSSAGEGIWFSMPNESVWVIIRIDDQHYNLPTVVITTQVYNGSLIFRRSANETDPVVSIEDFKAGEKVYVFDVPNEGYDHLGIGDLKVLANGVNNIVNLEKVVTTAASPYHIWSFTMPEGTLIFQATFTKAEAKEVTLTLDLRKMDGSAFAGAKVDVTVAGNTTTIPTSSTTPYTLKALEGQSVVITSATDGYSVVKVQSASGKGVNGSTYTIPDLSEEAIPYTDTLVVFLEENTYPIKWVASGSGSLAITDGSVNIVSAQAGKTVYIVAVPDTGYHLLSTTPTILTATDGYEVAVSGSGSVSDPWIFTMPADGVNIGVVFEADNDAQITFAATGEAGAQALLSMSAGETTLDSGSTMTWKFTIGTQITIKGVGSYDTVRVTDTSGFDKSGTSVTYTVSKDGETVLIQLSSSAKAVTLNLKTSSSYGTLNLTHSNDKSISEPATAFSVGDDLWFFATPATGYELDTDKTTITKNIGGTTYTYALSTTAPYCYEISGISGASGIPEGGITIDAYFRTKTVYLSFSGVGQVKVSGTSGEYTVDAGATPSPTVPFKFGETITLTPVGGYKWVGTGVTGVTVSGSGASTARSFKIDSEGPISLTLVME